MSVVQMSPCIVSERWSEVVEWSARILDLPVACRFASEGWARLNAASDGIVVVDPRHFGAPASGALVLDLEVRMLRRVVERAKGAGAKVLAPPKESPDGTLRAAIETPQGVVLWLRDERGTRKPGADLHQGPLHFTVGRQIAAPPARVFEAITRKEDLESFFVTRVKGDLSKEDKVTWSWEGHGDYELSRMELKANEFLSFHWKADRQGYDTRVQFALTPKDAGTELTITESGWDADPHGLKKAFDNCEGWTTFLGNLAVYLEHDIALMKS
jgi:uncharacterized protein YndB with AHSA1/START domain/predicted enzyme related to lactoylglutathione lyase